MVDIPKEMSTSDFKYFIVVPDLMVAGVFEEDEEFVHVAFLNGNAYSAGTVGKNSKEAIADQVLNGVAHIVKSYEEAMSFDISNTIPPEFIDYIQKKSDEK